MLRHSNTPALRAPGIEHAYEQEHKHEVPTELFAPFMVKTTEPSPHHDQNEPLSRSQWKLPALL
jgi:hypothetical protein